MIKKPAKILIPPTITDEISHEAVGPALAPMAHNGTRRPLTALFKKFKTCDENACGKNLSCRSSQ